MGVRAMATISGDSSPSSAESSFRELDDVFLQTQTRIWLGEVLHTRLDEQLNISDVLADGELLYKRVGSKKSSGRYMPYSNVDSFLKICKVLGLNGIDLFSPSDVVEKRDIRKVCICIRSLSKKARSKQLNVPNFDIVTYTVAMPTNMIGCIRRSLELSQCSFTSSFNHSPCKDSTLKFRQKNSVAAWERKYEWCSEETDEAESSCMGAQSYSSSTTNSVSVSVNLDSKSFPGVHSAVKKYALSQGILQSDIQDQEADEYEQGHYKSPCLRESGASISTHCVQNDIQLDGMSSPCNKSRMILWDRASHVSNGARHGHESRALEVADVDLSVGNDASIVGDSLGDNSPETSYISQHLASSELIVFGTDINDPALFDEDTVYNLFMGTDLSRSSSTQRTSQNGFRRKYSDDVEDVKVSSTTSMSSVLGRVLNFDFDDQFDSDDFRTAKVMTTELQIYEVDTLDKKSTREYESPDMAKYESLVHSLTPDIEEPQFEMKLDNFGFSAEPFLPYTYDWLSFSTDYHDVESLNKGIGMSRRDLVDALSLKNMNLVVVDNDEEAAVRKKDDMVVNDATMVDSDPNVKECLNNCLLSDCCGHTINMTSEDSNAICNTFAVERSGRCHSSLQHQDTIIRDVCTQGVVDVDNTIVGHNFDASANQGKSTAEKHPSSTVEIAEIVDKTGHQQCTVHIEDLSCDDSTNKDEGKLDDFDVLTEEISDGKSYTGCGLPQGKPHRRPILKTVVKGTALLGVLFFFLHLRNRSEGEKTSEAGELSCQIQESNGVMFSTRKARKGDRIDGIYPADKLKFGN